MTKNKKRLIIFGAIFGGIFTTILCVIVVIFINPFTWIMYGVDDPPKPLVDYAEFPFKVVYEHNGKIITVEDTLVIEHAGILNYGSGGKENSFKYYFKNNEGKYDYSHFVSLELDTNEEYTALIYLGYDECLMGSMNERPRYPSEYGNLLDGNVYIEVNDEYTSTIIPTKDELYSEYGIKIIEVELPYPVSKQTE